VMIGWLGLGPVASLGSLWLPPSECWLDMLLKHMLKNDVRLQVIFVFEHALDFGPELIEIGDASGISSGGLCRNRRGDVNLGVFASGFTIHLAFLCTTRDGVVGSFFQ
jgi:hypothetical protein